MARDYAAGAVSAQAFCEFYIGTLAGRSADDWQALRREFVDTRVVPRIGDGGAGSWWRGTATPATWCC